MNTQDQYLVNSVKRAMRVITVIAEHGPELGVTEIAGKAGLHKSTAHRLLVTLESEDWVRRVDASDKYSLGFGLLKAARSAQQQFSLYPVAHQELERLSNLSGETAILTILDPDRKHALCIDKVECQQSIKVISEIGGVVPLHAGASGKILGAYLSDEDFEALVSTGLQRYTKDTVTDPAVLREQFSKIREAGYVFTVGETERGVAGIAFPVFGPRKTVLAAISIAGPSFRFEPKSTLTRLTRLVRQSAATVSDAISAGNRGSD